MAVQEVAISAMSDIPPLVRQFAIDNGWIVSGTTAQPIIQHPSLVGAVPFTLRALVDGTTTGMRNRLQWLATVGTAVAANMFGPMRGTAGTPTFVAPTKLILFSGLLPEPYLAIVVEFGFNLYRHLYLGNMEKNGAYGGGEVIAGSIWGNQWTSTVIPWDDITVHQYPFSSYQGTMAASGAGGVRIEHADNPTPWRSFFTTSTVTPQSNLTLAAAGVMGGFRDSVNDIYMARGKNSFAGASMLVPINLYAVRPSNMLSHIGRPAGVRMINMENIEPATSLTVGSKTWRCFPAFRKSSATSIARPVTSWPPDETSYYVGYAYQEN
jgi:hypothetical protein